MDVRHIYTVTIIIIVISGTFEARMISLVTGADFAPSTTFSIQTARVLPHIFLFIDFVV